MKEYILPVLPLLVTVAVIGLAGFWRPGFFLKPTVDEKRLTLCESAAGLEKSMKETPGLTFWQLYGYTGSDMRSTKYELWMGTQNEVFRYRYLTMDQVTTRIGEIRKYLLTNDRSNLPNGQDTGISPGAEAEENQ